MNSNIAVANVTTAARRQGVPVRVQRNHLSLARGVDEFWLPHSQLALVPYVSENFDLFFSAVKPTTNRSDQRIVDFSRPGVNEFTSPPMTIETAGFPDGLDLETKYFHWHKPQQGDVVGYLGANVGALRS